MSESQIFVGIGLIIGLAVAFQIVAAKLAIPAIIVLVADRICRRQPDHGCRPVKLFGAAFTPLVSVAVAIILFDGGGLPGSPSQQRARSC